MKKATDIPARSNARQTAVHGSLWTLGGYGAAQILRLASNLLLARLLFPGAFGLMALVNVFMQGLEMLSDVGIGPGIIQNKRGGEPAFLRTAWTVQILRGATLWLVSILLAHPAAVFFGAQDPAALQLAAVLPVAGLTALIGGFNSTALFTLNKRMDMRRVTLLQLAPQAVALVVSIAWALAVAATVWAIVAGGLAAALARCLLSHAMNPGPADRPGWDRGAAAELGRFGRWVFASTLVSFLAQNMDRAILGRLLALDELGLYAIGMVFARVATNIATRITNTVVFPLLARWQDRPDRLLAFALRARGAVLWAGGAICAGFAVFAPAFFGLLYDPRYAGAGRISQWLALYVWTWILTATIDRIPLALGRPRALFNANLAGAAGLLLAWGGYAVAALPGFVCGLAAASLASHACVVAAIPARRASFVRQAAAASGLLLAYGLPAVLVTNALEGVLAPWPLAVVRGVAAAMPLVAALLVVRARLRQPAEEPEWLAWAEAASAGRIAAETLKERPNDVVILRTPRADGTPVIVKLWNRPGLWGSWRRLTGTNTGWREFDALRRLRRAGLAELPEPLAYLRLRGPDVRHTEALIQSDLGTCGDATEHVKAVRRSGGDEALRACEDEIIRVTRVMVDAGFIDTDHRLPNFVLRPDGRLVRLDFEMCRPVRRPRRAVRDLGLMLGTLTGSHAFALQPDTRPLRSFAERLAAAVQAPPAALAVARRRVAAMLERQRREAGIVTEVELPW